MIPLGQLLLTKTVILTYGTSSFAAFIALVIVRYFRQHVVQEVEDGVEEVVEKEQQQGSVVKETKEKEEEEEDLVLSEAEKKEQQQALVVAETEEKEKKQQQ